MKGAKTLQICYGDSNRNGSGANKESGKIEPREEHLMKKLLSLAMALAMLLTVLVLPASAEESLYPEELTIFCSLSEHVSKLGLQSLGETYMFQELEKRTGTKINWIHPAAGSDVDAQINLMVASDELPDLIIRSDWKNFNGGAALWAEDGVIYDLTDLIPEYMPHYNAYLQENPLSIRDLSVEDRMYYISEIQHGMPYSGPVYREDWLEKLNFDYPTTPDELYEVLVAFRDQDPNGNGQKDEWAMSGMAFDNSNFGPGQLLWPYGITLDFMQIDGKVTHGLLETDAFTAGMSFLNKLYTEGLLDPDYATQDRNSIDGKFMNDQVGFEIGIQPSKMDRALAGTTPFKAVGGPNLKLNADSPSYVFKTMYISALTQSCDTVVTTACEEPGKALRWLDNFYGGEGQILANFGIEGLSYEYVNGVPVNNVAGALEKDPQYSENEIKYLYTIVGTSAFPMRMMKEAYAPTVHELSMQGIERWAATADTSRMIPNISFTAEETEDINDLLVDLKTYISIEADKLVNGQTPISEIPNIQEKALSMGLDECIEIYQAAYNRYMGIAE